MNRGNSFRVSGLAAFTVRVANFGWSWSELDEDGEQEVLAVWDLEVCNQDGLTTPLRVSLDLHECGVGEEIAAQMALFGVYPEEVEGGLLAADDVVAGREAVLCAPTVDRVEKVFRALGPPSARPRRSRWTATRPRRRSWSRAPATPAPPDPQGVPSRASRFPTRWGTGSTHTAMGNKPTEAARETKTGRKGTEEKGTREHGAPPKAGGGPGRPLSPVSELSVAVNEEVGAASGAEATRAADTERGRTVGPFPGRPEPPRVRHPRGAARQYAPGPRPIQPVHGTQEQID